MNKFDMKKIILTVFILILSGSVHAQQPSCYHKELDDWAFLAGDWTVRTKTRLSANGPWEESVANAQIKRDMNGCLLAENFAGTRQGKAFLSRSLFAWNDNTKKLQQVFSDSEHGPLIFYEGVKSGPEILVDLDWKRPDGQIIRLRRAYFDLTKDSFKSESRRSLDGGKTWDTTGKADYSRRQTESESTRQVSVSPDENALKNTISSYHNGLIKRDQKLFYSSLGNELFMGNFSNEATQWQAHLFLTGENLQKWADNFIDNIGPHENKFEFMSFYVRNNAAIVVTKETGRNKFRQWKDETVTWLLGKGKDGWKILGFLIKDIKNPE